jgi:HPt (histidine-containing phosphotransfer) domain-containing protein
VSLHIQADNDPLNALISFAGGDTLFVQSLMSSWATQSEELLRDAIRAVYWFDSQLFLRAVHTLGGSSATVGLHDLADVCLRTESAVRSGHANSLGEHLGFIMAAYRVAKTEASHMLTDLSLVSRSRQET